MFKPTIFLVRPKHEIFRYKTTKKECHWELLLGSLGPLKSWVPWTISIFLSPVFVQITFKIPRTPKAQIKHSTGKQINLAIPCITVTISNSGMTSSPNLSPASLESLQETSVLRTKDIIPRSPVSSYVLTAWSPHHILCAVSSTHTGLFQFKCTRPPSTTGFSPAQFLPECHSAFI